MKKTTTPEEPLLPDNIARFLAGLPLTAKPVEWILTFRAALGELLGDVERIGVKVNLECNLAAPREHTITVDLAQIISSRSRRMRRYTTAHSSHVPSPSERMLLESQHAGLTLTEDHSPHCFDYYYRGKRYLGTMVLLQLRRKRPVSECSLNLVRALEPFIIYLFSNLVARHGVASPMLRIFSDIILSAWTTYGLTPREVEVLMLQALGLPYTRIAKRLFISEHTVAKRMKNIHRKTGCATFLELFARFFPADEANAPDMGRGEESGMVLVL